MLSVQRIQRIKDILQKYNSLDISTLSSMVGVSGVTIRKDLDKLEEEGFLTKFHGGAAINKMHETQPIEDYQNIENYISKDKIADLALSTIENGDTIFLGSGSTCYLLAKKIKKLSNINIITNNINALYELVPCGLNVYLLPGEVSCKNNMLYAKGSRTSNQFENMFVNKAYLSMDGVDFKAGYTINDFSLAALIKTIPSIAKYIIVLMDSSKYNKICLHHVGSLDFSNCVISDVKFDDSYKKYFFEQNIKLITAYSI